MLELHTRQVYTVDATAIKRARKNEKEGTKQKCRLGTASNEITGRLQLILLQLQHFVVKVETQMDRNFVTFK